VVSTTAARSESSKEKGYSNLDQVSCYNKRPLAELPANDIRMLEYLLLKSSC
jgi:hypothetical protein